MTLEICSQCKKTVELNKGFTVSFYTGDKETHVRACSEECKNILNLAHKRRFKAQEIADGKHRACVDQLVKKQKTK